jgi:glycosyltransferase involved in cell wall biosynthesis
MIRVAILPNSLNYTDGVSNHIYDLINGFKRNAKDVSFCIITGENNAAKKFDNLEIEILVWSGFQHSERSLINFSLGAMKLIRFVKERNINILHSHNHYHACIAIVCKALTAVTTIQTNHGIIPEAGILPHLSADRYIIINQHVVEYFKAQHPVKYRHANFIRCGIPELKLPRKAHQLLTFIAAGRFVHEKGFDTYIKAVNGLPEEVISRACFYLAGDGEEKASLLNLNNSLGNKVSYLGNVSTLQEKFFETDVLVNPSRSKSEGFPRTIVEAAFAGNLIITSNFLGVTNDLIPDRDGLLFDAESVEQLQILILKCVENFEIISDLQKNFTGEAKDIFSVDLMTALTERVYRDAILD